MHRTEVPRLERGSNHGKPTPPSRCGGMCPFPPSTDPFERSTTRQEGGRSHIRYGVLPRDLTTVVCTEQTTNHRRADKRWSAPGRRQTTTTRSVGGRQAFPDPATLHATWFLNRLLLFAPQPAVCSSFSDCPRPCSRHCSCLRSHPRPCLYFPHLRFSLPPSPSCPPTPGYTPTAFAQSTAVTSQIITRN